MQLCKKRNKKFKIQYKTLNFKVLFIVENPLKNVNNKGDKMLKIFCIYTNAQNIYYILYIIIKEKAIKKTKNKKNNVKS